jgi:hypothetical protein
MASGNARVRTERGTPRALTLTILATIGQGFAVTVLLIVALMFFPGSDSSEAEREGALAAVAVSTLLGCALGALTWVVSVARRRSAIVATIAGLLVAVAFPKYVERTSSLLDPGPIPEYEIGLTESMLLIPLPGAFAAGVGSFVGFAVALALLARRPPAGDSHGNERDSAHSSPDQAESASSQS